MKELRLERLALERFKGVERLQLSLGGRNAVISGQNGSGKTTVADAYTWLLTGKLSNGRTENASGIVEAAFTDGTVLRRESNGSSHFFFNGVPIKQRDFFDAVGELTGAATAILALPQNFCKVHWQDRRSILMTLFGKIDAKEVIAAEPTLAPLAGLLEQLSPEQLLARNAAQIKALRSELSGIPARIDELSRQTVTGDRAMLETTIADLQRKLESASAAVKREQETSRKELSPFNEANRLRKAVLEIQGGIEESSAQARAVDVELRQLRKDWAAFNAALEGTCPVCGSKVPNEKADELRSQLADISKRGKALADSRQILERATVAAKAKAAELEEQADRLQQQYEAAESKRDGSPLADAIDARDRIAGELNAAKLELARLEAADKSRARVEELKAQEVELNAQISALESEAHLAQSFIATKIRLIEHAVNSQFERVRFRMFEPYKTTDAVRECCEPVINDVGYGSLSKGERLMAALDILRALQKAYAVQLPVFIDDAESYTSNTAIPLPNQVIRLSAAEGDLRVTLENPQISLF